jgi:hypothetical protein
MQNIEPDEMRQALAAIKQKFAEHSADNLAAKVVAVGAAFVAVRNAKDPHAMAVVFQNAVRDLNALMRLTNASDPQLDAAIIDLAIERSEELVSIIMKNAHL